MYTELSPQAKTLTYMLYELPAGVAVSYVTHDARHAEVLRPQSLHRPVDVLLASTAHDDVCPVAAEAFSDGEADSATTNGHRCQTMQRNTLYYQMGNGPSEVCTFHQAGL